MGLPPRDHDDEDDSEEDDSGDDEEDTVAQPAATARAPPIAKRPAPRPTARKTGTGAGAKAKAVGAAKAKQGAAQPRTTTTMQIEHLTQQQPDPMMQWDNGSYQADYGDMDDSGDDEYYPPGGFGNGNANQTTTATADPSGWTMLDSDKIHNVRNAATTLLGLALERSDVGLDNVQANMISVLDWCRRQEETLSTNAAAQAIARQAPAPHVAPPIQPTQHTSSRHPAQYGSTSNHASQAPSTAQQPTYAPSHQYSNNQYPASTYSTLASAAAAAAPSAYQLPHAATSYPSSQSYHTGHAQSYPNNQSYNTQYTAQGYPTSHNYSTRIGL